MTEVERRFVLTKVASGDYLLPSNDGRTIWRIACFEGGGPTPGWSYWKWTGTAVTRFGPAVDLDDWSEWEFWDGGFRTRREAIEQVLKEEAA